MATQTIVSSQLDLEYNRRGQLSPQQRTKFERREVLYHLISIFMLFLGVLFVLVGLFDTRPSLLERIIAILFAIPFFALVVRSYRYPFSPPEVVEKIQGVLDDMRDVSAPESGPLWELHVGPHIFNISDTALAAGLDVNAEYIFYYAAHRHQKVLLAWERLAIQLHT
jgi:hypothetical protein